MPNVALLSALVCEDTGDRMKCRQMCGYIVAVLENTLGLDKLKSNSGIFYSAID